MLMTQHDNALTEDEWRGFLREHDFGQLIVGPPGRTVPTVVPTPYVYDVSTGIEFHLHRDNPVWEAVAATRVAVFTVLDAHTYIPTYWNAPPGTDPTWSAPTSYYAAVQVVGPITIIDDHAAIAEILTRQLRRAQPEGGHGPVEPGPTRFGRMLNGVLGARLDIAEVRAKFKFGGNKPMEHRRAIAANLKRRGGCMDLRARQHLLRRCREKANHE